MPTERRTFSTLLAASILVAIFAIAPESFAGTHNDPLAPDPSFADLMSSKDFHPGEINLLVTTPEEVRRRSANLANRLAGKKHKVLMKKDGTTVVILDQTARQTYRIHSANTDQQPFDANTFDSLANLFPKNGEVLFSISERFERQKIWSKALEYFKRASLVGWKKDLVDPAEPPEPLIKSKHYQANCAYFESLLGRNNEALKYYDRAIALSPHNSLNYLNRAQLYSKMGKTILAQKDLDKAKELAKNHKEEKTSRHGAFSHHRMHHTLVYTDDYDKAVASSTEEIKKLEKEPINLEKASLYLRRARAYKRLGHYKEALTDYLSLAKYEKYNPGLIAEKQLTETLLKTGAPPYGDLKVLGQSKVYLADGQNVKEVLVSELAKKSKGDLRVYTNTALMLSRKHRLKECAEQVDNLLKIEPNNLDYLKQRIDVAEAMDNAIALEKYCADYLNRVTAGDGTIDLDYAKRLFTFKAKAEFALAHYEKAVNDYSTLIKLDPHSPEAYRGRADCYTKLDKLDLAKADLDTAKNFEGSVR